MIMFKDKQVRLIINIMLAAFVIGLMWFALGSCNVQKKAESRVLSNPESLRKVWEAGVLEDWCKTDSAIKFLPGRVDSIPYPVPIKVKELDTAALNKAIKRAVDSSDHECLTGMELSYAAGYNDAIDKISKEKFADKKPDTFYITKWDRDKEKLLQKENDVLKAKVNSQSEQITQLKEDVAAANKSKRKAWLFLWLFVAVITAIILRKYWMGPAGKLLGVVGSVFMVGYCLQ